jgi:hypothetical protein
MSNNVIEACLVLSTSHLDEKTAKLLTAGMLKIPGFVVLSHGFYAHPWSVESFYHLGACPQCLKDCADLARNLGITRIFWDADADKCPLLHTYDW